ncbi:alcohol oxidase-like protein [Rhizoctonia solani AG-1 IA]|uniref:Alcohol oxidase-like protein n=1 Tax=Thanatephorus cucumeris (strain AG1-IA) TaxID=983506 RepID=L8X180_THACA|nr:alcohol oxidase-like protein [Rhizoctonia solani AG-1 IA]
MPQESVDAEAPKQGQVTQPNSSNGLYSPVDDPQSITLELSDQTRNCDIRHGQNQHQVLQIVKAESGLKLAVRGKNPPLYIATQSTFEFSVLDVVLLVVQFTIPFISQPPIDPTAVDIVFVGGRSKGSCGGGTSACAAAGRLAAANPEVNILLIEQGPNNLNEPTVITPGKSAAIKNREPLVVTDGYNHSLYTGGLLGGGSRDYDDWNTPGWGSKDLMPLLQKASQLNIISNQITDVLQIETYHITPNREAHGYEGPVNISYGDYFAQVASEYLDVCVSMGIPMVDDIMDLRTGHGCAVSDADVGTGQREDAAHRYIHTHSHNKRLHILTEILVTRVLFDKNKAIGVEVIGNKNQDSAADQTPRRIIARKLVVVSSGAIGTPIVLQRSGVGEATRLSKLGVDVVVDLPGVGANYEDHSSCMIPYHVPDDLETIDPVMEQNKEVLEKYLTQFSYGKGFLTTNLNDAGSRLRPTAEELKNIGPAFNEVWKRKFEQAPDKTSMPDSSKIKLIWMPMFGCTRSLGAKPSMFTSQAYLVFFREIFRRIPSYRGEYAPLHPRFPSGSQAACVHLEKAYPQGIEDLVYTKDDDAALEDWVGSVQMKPKEQGGCVDPRLNVYGAVNLKVADLSILPSNVGANTNSTALLIGEKAALIIAEDLDLNIP